MSSEGTSASTDLIRWTFRVPLEAVPAVEGHLTDLGADVFIREGQMFHVTWDEPDQDLDPVVEAVWGLAGQSFEITQEEFHRLQLHILQSEDEEPVGDAPTEFHPDFDALDVKDL